MYSSSRTAGRRGECGRRAGQGRGGEKRTGTGWGRGGGSRGGGENRLGADLALLKLAPAVCVHSCTGGSRTHLMVDTSQLSCQTDRVKEKSPNVSLCLTLKK